MYVCLFKKILAVILLAFNLKSLNIHLFILFGFFMHLRISLSAEPIRFSFLMGTGNVYNYFGEGTIPSQENLSLTKIIPTKKNANQK